MSFLRKWFSRSPKPMVDSTPHRPIVVNPPPSPTPNLPSTPSPDPITQLIYTVRNAQAPKLQEAMAELVKLGSPAVDPLIGSLNDSNKYMRARAADILGNIRDTGAVDPLLSLFQTEREDVVRSSIAEALGKLGDKRAIDVLLPDLQNVQTPRNVREVISNTLVQLGVSDAPQIYDQVNDRIRSALRAYWRHCAIEWWKAAQDRGQTRGVCDSCSGPINADGNTYLESSRMRCENCAERALSSDSVFTHSQISQALTFVSRR